MKKTKDLYTTFVFLLNNIKGDLMFKKAQAAMEFLMTYGWAILVVLIVLAALFYLGIFTPSTPNVCIASAPITCPDVRLTGSNDQLTIVMATSGTQSASLVGAAITLRAPVASPVTCDPTPDTISSAAPAGHTCTFVATIDSGQKYAGSAIVTYRLQGSTIDHTTTVDFSGTVE